MSTSPKSPAKNLGELSGTDSDSLVNKLKMQRLPKLRELDSKPSMWNGNSSETVYGIFQTKFYLIDSDFLLDPYASFNPTPRSFEEKYRYSVRGIVREAIDKNEGFKRSYEDLLHHLDTVLRDIDYDSYSFENDVSFLASAGSKLSTLRRFGAKKKVLAKPTGKKKKRTGATGAGGDCQELSSTSSTGASDVNGDSSSPSPGEGLSEHSTEVVGLGRFFNFVVSLERIVRERLFVKELSEKYFFRSFSDFVQAIFMDGNPANDVFIYDVIQHSCMTFYSPVDNYQLLVQSDSDLIIQQDDGQSPQKTVAVIQCKYKDQPLCLKYEDRCTTPEVKSDEESTSPKKPEFPVTEQTKEEKLEKKTRILPEEIDPEICRYLTSAEIQELDNTLPQCVGDIFASFDQPSIFDKRIDPLESYKNKSYRLGISVLGLRVMFIAIVIVDPKSRGKPHPTLLPGSLHRKLGMQTDVFVSRQFDLLNLSDRKSIAKVFLAISQFDKVFKR